MVPPVDEGLELGPGGGVGVLRQPGRDRRSQGRRIRRSRRSGHRVGRHGFDHRRGVGHRRGHFLPRRPRPGPAGERRWAAPDPACHAPVPSGPGPARPADRGRTATDLPGSGSGTDPGRAERKGAAVWRIASGASELEARPLGFRRPRWPTGTPAATSCGASGRARGRGRPSPPGAGARGPGAAHRAAPPGPPPTGAPPMARSSGRQRARRRARRRSRSTARSTASGWVVDAPAAVGSACRSPSTPPTSCPAWPRIVAPGRSRSSSRPSTTGRSACATARSPAPPGSVDAAAPHRPPSSWTSPPRSWAGSTGWPRPWACPRSALVRRLIELEAGPDVDTDGTAGDPPS